MFVRYVLPLTSLLASALALPLASRDVVAPPVTSPTASTVWYVGQTETVTWNTTNLPVNQTNPVGSLILGYWYNNSENLMLDSPLATNLNYSVGQAQVTVPDVPSGTNYIVVLFGDSGNASPQFTIINGASSTSAVPPPVTTSPSNSASTVPAAPASSPSSASQNVPNNVAASSQTSNAASYPSGSGQTASATGTGSPSLSIVTYPSTTVTVTPSATLSSSSGQTSAALRKHIPCLETLSISLAFIYFAFS